MHHIKGFYPFIQRTKYESLINRDIPWLKENTLSSPVAKEKKTKIKYRETAFWTVQLSYQGVI